MSFVVTIKHSFQSYKMLSIIFTGWEWPQSFRKTWIKKREVEEKDCQARLIKLEADSAERLRLSEEQR